MSRPLRKSESTRTQKNNSATPGSAPPAKILLDELEVLAPRWCWREDWAQGGESSYCLLGILQILNIVTNKRLIAEFSAPVVRSNGQLCKYPTIDLRLAAAVRLGRLARALRQSTGDLNDSFVQEAFPQAGSRCYTHLRWCPACIQTGYHASMFQLLAVQACPAHHRAMCSRCPRCNSTIPYTLDPNARWGLFCCIHCGLDLAMKIRPGWNKPVLSSELLNRIREQSKLMQFCDALPMLTSKYFQETSFSMKPNILIACPAQQDSAVAYSTFVTRVITAAKANTQMDWEDPADTCQFREMVEHRFTYSRMNSGWLKHLVPPSDIKLTLAASIYRCVRRHVWRKFVKLHRKCVGAAARHLWWPLSGSVTSTMCPVAAAYLRWRIHWESATTATMLLAQPSCAPLGLVGWLSMDAPIGGADWTGTVQNWLISHVLGRDLLATFEALIEEELARPKDGQISWRREDRFAKRSCWVCVGRGTQSSPACLFVRPDNGLHRPPFVYASRSHYKAHLGQLSRIKH